MKLYKIALWKHWFDVGYGVSSPLKWVLGIIGIGELVNGAPVSSIIKVALIYGIFCFVFGWLWYKIGMAIAMQEVNNQYDLFAKQLREKFNIGKFK